MFRIILRFVLPPFLFLSLSLSISFALRLLLLEHTSYLEFAVLFLYYVISLIVYDIFLFILFSLTRGFECRFFATGLGA